MFVPFNLKAKKRRTNLKILLLVKKRNLKRKRKQGERKSALRISIGRI